MSGDTTAVQLTLSDTMPMYMMYYFDNLSLGRPACVSVPGRQSDHSDMSRLHAGMILQA